MARLRRERWGLGSSEVSHSRGDVALGGHSQWAQWDGLGLGLGVLEVFSNHNDSLVLFRAMVSGHSGMGWG